MQALRHSIKSTEARLTDILRSVALHMVDNPTAGLCRKDTNSLNGNQSEDSKQVKAENLIISLKLSRDHYNFSVAE